MIINWPPGLRLNIETIFPRYEDSHVKDKMVVRLSYLKHEDPYTDKMTSFYWDAPQGFFSIPRKLKHKDIHIGPLMTKFVI